MWVKALKDCEVNGEKHKKGAEFAIASSSAARTAQADGVVKILGDHPPAKAEK